MKKSALILGLIAFLAIIGGAILSPLCTPCIAIFVGAIAGYLSGVFDKPAERSAALKGGALAGLLAGLGAILGQIVGAVINGAMVGPEGAMDLVQQLNLPISGAQFADTYWVALVLSTVCFGVLNIALMAGTGALGGLVWNSMNNKQVPPPAVSMQ